MNEMLAEFAQGYLKTNVIRLPEGSQAVFKKLYGRNYGKRTVEDAVLMSVNDIVEEMPIDLLDWAMIQVKRSMDQNNLK